MPAKKSIAETILEGIEKIQVGSTYDWEFVNVHFVKVSKKHIDVWVGTKNKLIPRLARQAIDLAKKAGYEVTYTIKYDHPELFEPPKKKLKQQGLRGWTE